MTYTFDSLSDADFEDLCCDLLSESLQLRFQSFRRGRDSGIDLLQGARLFGNVVVQCKHYRRSTYAQLKHKIEAEELLKIRKIAPSRYILATSLGLTPANKEELRQLLAPFCLGVDDIYGADDINALLRRHDAIELKHHKLWLTSVAVLRQVLKHGAAVWNTLTADDLRRQMAMYVQTDAYAAAMELLSKCNYCVISGIPGIGKSTLARVLVTRLMDQGCELISVRQDVHEVFESLDLSKRQVVYYDDFLGQSSIGERLGKNEDRGIVRLLKEAQRNANLKVVFTTREYILEDAKRVYEPLNSGELDIGKCIVKVEDYTRGHRARILYNHVYFSGLPRSYGEALRVDRGYCRIIDHRGYNPRIVEWMTLEVRVRDIDPADYVDEFVRVLDNPSRLWEHAFEQQIGDEARAVLYCLATTEGLIGLRDVSKMWCSYVGRPVAGSLDPKDKKKLFDALRQLEGSFIRSNLADEKTVVGFHNPSIKDYVRRRVAEDADIRRHLLDQAIYFEQVACLVSLGPTGEVEKEPFRLIKEDEQLHRAIAATIAAQSPAHQVEDHIWLGLISKSESIAARLATISSWAVHNRSARLMSFACDRFAERLAKPGERKLVDGSTTRFLENLHGFYPEGHEDERLFKPLVAAMADWLADYGSVEDWENWYTLVQSQEKHFGKAEIAEWRQIASDYATRNTSRILDRASSLSAAEEDFESLKAMAEMWDVDTSDMQYDFDSQASNWTDESQSRSRDPDDYLPRSGRSLGSSDGDIDRLFNSLGD